MALQHLQPRSLAGAMEAICRLGDDHLDQAMLNSLAGLPAAKTLSMDQLRNLYRNRRKDLQSLADRTIETLSTSTGDIESKVDVMLAKLLLGDEIRGLTLFRSQKTACSGCHRVAYVGGEIGPELTRIGSSRTRRALLEAIMFPNARLEQSYQPTKVLTKDGQVYNGLIKKYLDPTHFEMQLTVDKTVTIDSTDIEQQEPSSISIMPSGVVDLLTIQELSDLMAFLESAK
jgi:putative heme-binding domain-containing protein